MSPPRDPKGPHVHPEVPLCPLGAVRVSWVPPAVRSYRSPRDFMPHRHCDDCARISAERPAKFWAKFHDAGRVGCYHGWA